ncbi:hypoxia up-regulated protein 1 [Pocillopora verrucosa]|uniref:hypoxia up-regulated protein 1 n=1 Tax=Pocillopora verrucosa TaxID=203993 RepID=UPI0033403B15
MLIRKPGTVLFIAAVALSFFVSSSDGLAVMSVDLGSQFMKVAIVKPGVPMEIALNTESRRKTPVAVSLRDNERLFSDSALTMSVKYPKSSYIYVQNVLGKKFSNPMVEQYKQRFPWYDLEEDKETGTVLFRHDSEITFSPEEILGMILNHSRNIAEKFADHPMKDVVITVPSFFNQAERRSVLRAARLVGLNVLQLMNENTAVALHYGVFRRASFNNTERFIMFYDMGATSTVATIVGYSTVKTKDRGITETAPQVVVKGVGFDRTLGGHAMEMLMRDHLIKLFKEQHKTQGDVTQSPRAMAKFLKEAARVKQVLSANTEIFAQIEGAFEEKDFRAKVTREEFEEMCSDLLKRVSGPVEQALKSSAIPLDEIESVILVGGGTRVPKVQELLLKAVKKSELGKNVNADEAAALGAVYQAANLGKGFKVKKFLVKEANIYPVQVSFERANKAEDGSQTVKHVKRMLYHRMNVLPQKKVMTFNRHTDDFNFHASYTDLDFLSEDEQSMLGSMNLTTVSVKGVAAALDKHTPKGESKGIKAYFRMDESGILNLEKVESVFEKPEEKSEEEQSTFAKIGSKISSFFGSSGEEENKESKVEEGDKSEEAEGEKTEKEETGEEKAKTKEDEKSEEKAAEKDEDKKQDEGKNEDKQEEQGKEDGERKSDEKKEEEEEKGEKNGEKKEESSEAKKDGDKQDEKAGNKTEDAKKEKSDANKPSKPVTVREPLEMALHWVDVSDTSDDVLSASVKKLKDLQAKDEAKAANERAKNLLETHIYGMREELFTDTGVLLSTEEEREKIDQALSEASDWLDDEGWDSTADVYETKLQKLKDQSYEFRIRLKEHKERPKAVEMLKSSLNLSKTFLVQIDNITDKDEIYTAKDLEELSKLINDTTEWIEKNEKKQKEAKPSDKPVFLVKDIETKQGKIDRELVYLLNKAKYYVPKPKVNETASNTTKPKTDAKKEKQEKGNKAEGASADKKEDEKDKDEKKSKDNAKEDEKTKEESMGKQEKPDESNKKQSEQDKKESDEAEPLPLPGSEAESSTSGEPADSSSSSEGNNSKQNAESSDSSSSKKSSDEL